MVKQLLFNTTFILALSATAPAQNSNTAATPAAPAQGQTPAAPARTRRAATGDTAQARAVREAFDSLVDGIRRADAESVAKLYWNSPQLTIFNNNGTVTKSYEQARSNRESLYAKVSDVKLDVRDVRVKTLGPSAALVTCLWEQSQTAEGQPERATGRLSIVYQKVGTEWKIVHTHTSPDRPDPSRLLPSERTTDATTKPTPPRP
ncbi:MAG TPA: SgcJ/EcaC family oxidoreductase [Pyrinomonadaceae bacterium]|nr:SgcJ/EcaC family oxidoreductase [Pyrinomonadaceae bacterium]